MTPVVIRLNEETLDGLDDVISLKHCTRTSIVRNAVNMYLTYFKNNEEPKLRKSNEDSQSLYTKLFTGQ